MLKKLFFWIGFVFLISVAVVVAQETANCPVIVDEALQALGDNCGSMDRNTACYGANMVESATTMNPRPANFFIAPSDRAELTQLREIRPLPLDVENRTFGIGVLNVEADIPRSIPGQGVIFLLMGDARLTNEVTANSGDQTPFQSFYFLPGIGKATCYEAEPILTIQTPQSTTINIVLNGVDTEMRPGTLLTLTPSVCTVHRGTAILRPGTATVMLNANQTVDVRIDEDGNVIGQGSIRAISQREFERGEAIQGVLNELAANNEWWSHTLPKPVNFAPEPLVQSSCSVQHTMQPGDTLYTVARTYATTVTALMWINQIPAPDQFTPGQTLCIPEMGG